MGAKYSIDRIIKDYEKSKSGPLSNDAPRGLRIPAASKGKYSTTNDNQTSEKTFNMMNTDQQEIILDQFKESRNPKANERDDRGRIIDKGDDDRKMSMDDLLNDYDKTGDDKLRNLIIKKLNQNKEVIDRIKTNRAFREEALPVKGSEKNRDRSKEKITPSYLPDNLSSNDKKSSAGRNPASLPEDKMSNQELLENYMKDTNRKDLLDLLNKRKNKEKQKEKIEGSSELNRYRDTLDLELQEDIRERGNKDDVRDENHPHFRKMRKNQEKIFEGQRRNDNDGPEVRHRSSRARYRQDIRSYEERMPIEELLDRYRETGSDYYKELLDKRMEQVEKVKERNLYNKATKEESLPRRGSEANEDWDGFSRKRDRPLPSKFPDNLAGIKGGEGPRAGGRGPALEEEMVKPRLFGSDPEPTELEKELYEKAGNKDDIKSLLEDEYDPSLELDEYPRGKGKKGRGPAQIDVHKNLEGQDAINREEIEQLKYKAASDYRDSLEFALQEDLEPTDRDKMEAILEGVQSDIDKMDEAYYKRSKGPEGQPSKEIPRTADPAIFKRSNELLRKKGQTSEQGRRFPAQENDFERLVDYRGKLEMALDEDLELRERRKIENLLRGVNEEIERKKPTKGQNLPVSGRNPSSDDQPEFDPDAPSEEIQPEFDPDQPSYDFSDQEEVDDGGDPRAFRVGGERAVTFGARPAIAGLGAGVGGFVGGLESGQGLGGSIRTGIDSFKEARQEAITEQDSLAENYPEATISGGLAGGLATGKFFPVGTFKEAIKVGAMEGVGQAIGEADGFGDAVLKTVASATGGGLVHGTFKVGGKVISALVPKTVMLKLANNASGIPEQDIKTYLKYTDDVEKIIKDHKGNIHEAADQAKRVLNNRIKNVREEANQVITDHLDIIGKDKAADVDITPILDDMLFEASSIHPITQASELAQVKEIRDTILSLVPKNGRPNHITKKDLFALQKYLQENSKKAFMKNGEIFHQEKNISRTAKAGYLKAKSLMDVISPEIKEANLMLHELHNIEEVINPNMLKIGKSDVSYLTGGSGENWFNQKSIDRIGMATGTDALGEAQKISAAEKFANPTIFPRGTTGHTWTRLISGAGVGAGAFYLLGLDPKTGMAMGAASTGPLTIKYGIKAINTVRKAIPTIKSAAIQQITQKSVERSSALGHVLKNKYKKEKEEEPSTSVERKDTGAIGRRINSSR